MCVSTDSLWSDQIVDVDVDLPSGWRTIRDSVGSYYWHVPTGATQWQHPSYSAEEDSTLTTSHSKTQVSTDKHIHTHTHTHVF